jgi:hypothetical protein
MQEEGGFTTLKITGLNGALIKLFIVDSMLRLV